MAHLPIDARGRPVPTVASWSSETWGAIRLDPLVGRQAIFSGGRQGRGRPILGVLNEPRQRRAAVLARCQVCDAQLEHERRPTKGGGTAYLGRGWLPHLDRVAHEKAGDLPVTTEPLCCEVCARFAADQCPGLADGVAGLHLVTRWVPVLQLVDPSRAPMAHAPRFDGRDPTVERERLGRIARRFGGAVGYVKLALVEVESVP